MTALLVGMEGGAMGYDDWKQRDVQDEMACWADVGCKWCTGVECADCGDGACVHEMPCSEDCERIACLAARQRRLDRLAIAIARATSLRDQYRLEGDVATRRLSDVKERIAQLRDEYDATSALQVRDLKEAAE